MGRLLVAGGLFLLLGCAPASVTAERVQSASPPEGSAPMGERRVRVVAPPPEFSDPQRREKLESAIPAIDAYLQRMVERDGLVGLAAGVVIDGELVWARGYGFRDPARRLPVEPDTAFGVGSITKTVTALAILLLRDRGLLELDAPAETYLPELAGLVYPTADSPAITIRHLLTHASGLPRMGNFPEYPSSPQTRAEFLASLQGLPLERPPDVAYVYSNLGVQILGPLIDNVAKEDHRTFIRREVLEPIGMTGAGWTPQEVGIDRLALPHELDEDRKPRQRPHWTPGAADAAGGLYASVEDLARYAAFNLAAWPAGGSSGDGPLRAATIRQAHTLSTVRSFHAANGPSGEPATGGVNGHGIGFSVYSNCRYEHVVAHNGKTLGHRAWLQMLPQHGVAVVLLTNLSSIHSSVMPRDGQAIMDLLHATGGLKPRLPAAAPSLAQGGETLARLLTTWSADEYAGAFSPDFRDSNPADEIASMVSPWNALLGSCEGASVHEVDETYAGEVELVCDRGPLRVDLRVAPWQGHPITSMRILGAPAMQPGTAAVAAAKRAVDLLNQWRDEAFAELFSTSTSRTGIHDFLGAVSGAVGTCELGPPRWAHPHGEILIGIHEGDGFEDEGCFVADDNGCPPNDDRIRGKFVCNSGTCSSTSFADAAERPHGTWVTSILLGDYKDNQGLSHESSIASGLPSDWRSRASSGAQEAEGYYYAVGNYEDGKVAGFECARGVTTGCSPVDIVHSANPIKEGVCDAASWMPIEAAMEDAWDDGILPVIVTHNDNRYYTGTDQCLVASPADLPKALAVGALEPSDQTPYGDWLYAGYSNRGGGTSKIGSLPYPNSMSMVDLVASAEVVNKFETSRVKV